MARYFCQAANLRAATAAISLFVYFDGAARRTEGRRFFEKRREDRQAELESCFFIVVAAVIVALSAAK